MSPFHKKYERSTEMPFAVIHNSTNHPGHHFVHVTATLLSWKLQKYDLTGLSFCTWEKHMIFLSTSGMSSLTICELAPWSQDRYIYGMIFKQWNWLRYHFSLPKNHVLNYVLLARFEIKHYQTPKCQLTKTRAHHKVCISVLKQTLVTTAIKHLMLHARLVDAYTCVIVNSANIWYISACYRQQFYHV